MLDKLIADGNRVVRPRDAASLVRNPSKEFARLVRSGTMLRLSNGYFVVVPEAQRSGYWRPTIEGVALGIGIADYGSESAALMGISAARVLGFVPRATGAAVVMTGHQRPVLATEVGRLVFVKRRMETMDVQAVETDVVAGLAATPEQTALDMADRPELGGITTATATDTITLLAARLDWDLAIALSKAQSKMSALARLAWVASAVVDPPTMLRQRRPVDAKGLRPVGARPAAEFGIEP